MRVASVLAMMILIVGIFSFGNPAAVSGNSGQEPCVYKTGMAKPNPPRNLQVTPGNNRLLVTWDPPASGPVPCTYYIEWSWNVAGDANTRESRMHSGTNRWERFAAPGVFSYMVRNITDRTPAKDPLPNGYPVTVRVYSIIPKSWNDFGPDGTKDNSNISREARVTGTPQAPASASTDATLSGLYVVREGGKNVSLTPSFASATTAYKGGVGHSDSWVGVYPVTTDVNATFTLAPKSGTNDTVDSTAQY